MANQNIPFTKSRTLEEFKGRMIGGGARPNLFECELNFPVDALPEGSNPVSLSNLTRFLIKAASLPASNLGLISVPFFGRAVKMAGDRTFDPWTVTIINDEDFAVRASLESWSNSINSMRGNVRSTSSANLTYKANASVTQYSKTGEILRVYKFEGLYPANISAIDLAWANENQIEEFQVQFEYDNWVLDTGKSIGIQ
jgi:hypothetical protein